jgi:hypothetical protein
MTERQNEALKRLLADASQGGQSKVDALIALSQRTLWVVPWDGVEGYRTLVNSTGLAALPVFTSEAELNEAAQRFAWLSPAGTVNHKEIGARAAFGYAHEKNLGFVVVDITSEHSLEISRDELTPLLTQNRRESAGPFAAAGRIESSLMAAVSRKSEPGMTAVRAPTPPPGAVAAVRPPTPAAGVPAVRAPTPVPGGLPAASPPSGSVTIPTSLPAGALPPRQDRSEGPAFPDAVAQIQASSRLFPPGRAAGWGASLRKRTRRPELRYGPTPRPSRRGASRDTREAARTGRAAGWGASLRKRTRRPELRYGPTPRPSRRGASRDTREAARSWKSSAPVTSRRSTASIRASS